MIAGLPVIAEPVALKEGLGQGLLFQNRGNCYVLFPAHVHQRGRSVNLFTSSPQAGGSAIIYFRRAEADIAVGVVSGGARERCARSFAKLPRDVSQTLINARLATLERVNPQGVLERLSMRIDNVNWDNATSEADTPGGLYHYVYASTSEGESREVYQGTSGAFLYVGDTPVAMVVTAPDATTVKALRIEEITRPLSRWLASGSFGALQAEASQPDSNREGIAYQLTEWSGLLVDPDLSPTGLASGTAPFRVLPSGKNVSFVLELSEEEAVRVREIVLDGPSDQDAFAVPRSITIDVDRGRPGRTDFQSHATVEMSPERSLVVPINTFARQLRVRVSSSWTPGLPIEISAVRVIALD
ncbi:MAG: hypothetical protein AB3N19_07685 [Ruegeria sp.]